MMPGVVHRVYTGGEEQSMFTRSNSSRGTYRVQDQEVSQSDVDGEK